MSVASDLDRSITGRLPGFVVLVVEDEPVVRDVVTEVLRLAGADVLSAPDAARGLALAAAHSERLGAVLLDLRLPDMAAGDLVPAIVKAAPGAAVVLMTGGGHRAASELVDLEGVAGFLAKPFEVAELLAALEGAAGTR